MDVRCERCKTQYELDDSRISETGVTVQCTTCHHVFVVKKKALVVTVPVKPDKVPQTPMMVPPPPEAGAAPPETPPPSLRPLSAPIGMPPPVATAAPPPEPPAPSLPPATASAGAREWRVRQASGNVFTLKDLTTLQKWIVERKVARDDEISLTGDTWKRLGDIAELATFFQLVDEAQRAAVLQAQVSMPPPPQPSTPPAGAPAQAPPPQRQGSRWTGLLIGLLVLLGLGGAGYYFLVLTPRVEEEVRRAEAARQEAERLTRERQEQERQEQERQEKERQEKERQEKERQAQILAAQAAAEAQARADAGSSEDGGTSEDAGTALDAGTAADAGPTLDAGAPGVKKPSQPKTFDGWMAQGDRLRERDKDESALDAYAEAAELEPDRPEPYTGRGLALLDMGSPQQAEAEFKQALKISPNSGEAIMGLAETYRTQGKKAEAIRYYERYLVVLPNGPDAPVARSAIQRLKE